MIMTIDNVRESLREQEAQFTAHSVSVSDLRTEPGLILADATPLRLASDGLGSLCRQVGAPAEYVTKLSASLQAEILQHHFDRGDLQRGPVTLIARDEELVAIERGALHRLSSVDVLDAVAEGVAGLDLKVHRLQVEDHAFQLDLVIDSLQSEIVPGDIVQGGLHVSHSFVGGRATVVEAYVLRLVCSNGMTHRQCITQGSTRTRRLPTQRPDAHDLQMAQIRRLAMETAKSLRIKLETMKSLRLENVDVEPLIRRWIERARLSTRHVLPLVRAAWMAEGGRPTAYDAMNALTNVATHDRNLDARVRRLLSGLAGILAFRQIHFCPRCFSLVSPSVSANQAV